ncbi:hypothetical protein TNCT_398601 [Trichonephila clavata]|uniref:Uncharacterized protein n=1 Tax=Trichonephila clavata TaxID=2740835 RepID=A0A8X6J2V8_TRICU|nr:hypothetical protein TNCT_398601 [Trichonephila clavata]
MNMADLNDGKDPELMSQKKTVSIDRLRIAYILKDDNSEPTTTPDIIIPSKKSTKAKDQVPKGLKKTFIIRERRCVWQRT